VRDARLPAEKTFASTARDFLPNPCSLSKRVISRNVHGWKTRMTLGIRIDRRSAETLGLTLPDSRAISNMLFATWKQSMQHGGVGSRRDESQIYIEWL